MRVSLFVGRLLHHQICTTVTKLLHPAPVRIPHQIGGKPVTLFVANLLPTFVSLTSRVWSHQFEDIQSTGTIVHYVIGPHILPTLWHHFGRRDNTLKRWL